MEHSVLLEPKFQLLVKDLYNARIHNHVRTLLHVGDLSESVLLHPP